MVVIFKIVLQFLANMSKFSAPKVPISPSWCFFYWIRAKVNQPGTTICAGLADNKPFHYQTIGGFSSLYICVSRGWTCCLYPHISVGPQRFFDQATFLWASSIFSDLKVTDRWQSKFRIISRNTWGILDVSWCWDGIPTCQLSNYHQQPDQPGRAGQNNVNCGLGSCWDISPRANWGSPFPFKGKRYGKARRNWNHEAAHSSEVIIQRFSCNPNPGKHKLWANLNFTWNPG